MENIDWEHLDSLLWTGEKTNIKLAVTIAKGMQVLPQWQTYQQLKQCVDFFERQWRKRFSVTEFIKYIQANGIDLQQQMTDFPDYIAVLSPIARSIRLDMCRLVAIPPFVFKMHNLEDLNLSGNELTELPDELFDLKKLRVLNISYNHITSIPTAIQHLHQLTELQCISFEYCQLPAALPTLPQLRRLVFGIVAVPTQFVPVPAIIFECRALTSLEISGLTFDEMPAAVAQLAQLETLCVASTSMSNLPDELSKLLNLKELRFSSMVNMSELPHVVFALDNLRSLYIFDTPIGKIPREFANLQQLECIEISGINIPPQSFRFWEQKLYSWLPNTVVHWYA